MLALCEQSARRVEEPRGSGRKLVVQLARLGDFLQTTPLLAALGSPEVVITPAQLPLARAARVVGGVRVLDPAALERAARAQEPRALRLARLAGLLAGLDGEPPEVVYNLNLSPLCAALTAAWPKARLRGWRLAPGGEMVGEGWMPHLMALMRARRLVRLHLSDVLASYADPAAPPLARLDHHVTTSARDEAQALLPTGGPLVVLQLGANHDLRRWPVASFAALARSLMDQGARVALAGAGREKVLARRFLRELGSPAAQVTDLMARTGLETLGGVLAQADLVVSADTGTLHLATAVGARVLALYMGPAQVHETGPYGAGHLVLQARDQCGPCAEANPVCKGAAPCRRLIAPEAALAACRALLDGATADQAASSLGLPPGVESWCGEMDAFGQHYRLLSPRPLGLEDGLALALRQAGRSLLRGAYGWSLEDVAGEMARSFAPARGGDQAALSDLARVAASLARAAQAGDGAAARRLAAGSPGLASLAFLVGPGAPVRLNRACRAAAQVLEIAARGGEG